MPIAYWRDDVKSQEAAAILADPDGLRELAEAMGLTTEGQAALAAFLASPEGATAIAGVSLKLPGYDAQLPVARRVDQRFKDLWAMPEDFGGVGDGVTDDLTPLTRLLNSGAPNIRFAKGKTYAITAPLPFPAGKHLLGNGAKILAKAPGTWVAHAPIWIVFAAPAYFEIEDLEFECEAGVTLAVLRSYGLNGARIQRCKFSGFLSSGSAVIQVQGDPTRLVKNLSILDNTFDNCGIGTVVYGQSENTRFERNVGTNMIMDLIRVVSITTDMSKGVYIRDNRSSLLNGNHHHIWVVANDPGPWHENVWIEGNWVLGRGLGYDSDPAGGGADQISTNGIHGLHCNFNTSIGGGDLGIAIEAVLGGEVIGNDCRNNAQYGIGIAEANQVTVLGNICYDNSDNGTVVPAANRFGAPGAGIWIAAATDMVVDGNICGNLGVTVGTNAGGKQDYGVFMGSSVDRIKIGPSNLFQGCPWGDVWTNGSLTRDQVDVNRRITSAARNSHSMSGTQWRHSTDYTQLFQAIRQQQQLTTAEAVAGATSVSVQDLGSPFAVGSCRGGLRLDDLSIHWCNVTWVNNTTVTISPAIPVGRSAPSGSWFRTTWWLQQPVSMATTPTLHVNGFIETPTAKTYTLIEKSATSGVIVQFARKLGAGTATLSVEINGVPVTGLSAMAATTTQVEVAASGLNSFAAGARVTMTVSSPVGAADLAYTMRISWNT